jgi:hypothetical protein
LRKKRCQDSDSWHILGNSLAGTGTVGMDQGTYVP